MAAPAKKQDPRIRHPLLQPDGLLARSTARAILPNASNSAATRVADVDRRNRMQATDYASRVGMKRVTALLKESQADLKARLANVHPALGTDTFTPIQLNATLAQIQSVMDGMKPGMSKAVDAAKQAAADQAHELSLKMLESMDERFVGIVHGVPLEVAMQFDPDAVGENASILRRLMQNPEADPVAEGIIDRYGENVVTSFEDKLRVGMVTGKSFKEMREDITSESTWLQDSPVSWAQRIVRTEVMGAYSRAALENADGANKILGDMVKILVAGFDNRTAWDSYQVHGQIRKLSEPFEWITKQGQRIAYMTPPNRPNDRETVIYQRVSTEIPDDMKPISDDEYEAKFVEQNKSKKNPSPVAPPRPRMTTVPLEWFGVGIPEDKKNDFEEASAIDE